MLPNFSREHYFGSSWCITRHRLVRVSSIKTSQNGTISLLVNNWLQLESFRKAQPKLCEVIQTLACQEGGWLYFPSLSNRLHWIPSRGPRSICPTYQTLMLQHKEKPITMKKSYLQTAERFWTISVFLTMPCCSNALGCAEYLQSGPKAQRV